MIISFTTLHNSTHIIFPSQLSSYSFNVVHEVHERGVCPEWLEDLSLVDQGVDQVGVVVEAVGQTRVHYLQHHLQYLLHYLLFSCLETRKCPIYHPY